MRIALEGWTSYQARSTGQERAELRAVPSCQKKVVCLSRTAFRLYLYITTKARTPASITAKERERAQTTQFTIVVRLRSIHCGGIPLYFQSVYRSGLSLLLLLIHPLQIPILVSRSISITFYHVSIRERERLPEPNHWQQPPVLSQYPRLPRSDRLETLTSTRFVTDTQLGDEFRFVPRYKQSSPWLRASWRAQYLPTPPHKLWRLCSQSSTMPIQTIDTCHWMTCARSLQMDDQTSSTATTTPPHELWMALSKHWMIWMAKSRIWQSNGTYSKFIE